MIGKTLRHYCKVLVGLDQPQTQTSQPERDTLCKHLAGRKTLVEIGVFEGFTSKVILDHADPNATLYGVDPFFGGRIGISWGEKITRHHNRPSLLNGRLKLVRNYSTEVGDKIPAQVDFVFVDGDHSLEGIAADWAFWRERVIPGGVIALHDTILKPGQGEANVLGSHRYFDSCIRHDPNFELVDQIGSLSVMRRR